MVSGKHKYDFIVAGADSTGCVLANRLSNDAPIMPRIIGGNTKAPITTIAEKASDMILGKAQLDPENTTNKINAA